MTRRLADHALEVFLTARNRVALYPDVRPALERLRARYRLFAVSNGNADLRAAGIADLFDGHVTARGAGAAKPDERIFMRMLGEAGVRAADVLHVGDDPLADVVGARARDCRPSGSIATRVRGPITSSRRRAPSRTLAELA
jgi:FMN hydrolase / 5-amino-6-(5-phospho-D-ribitylamino)uracil phosphatase